MLDTLGAPQPPQAQTLALHTDPTVLRQSLRLEPPGQQQQQQQQQPRLSQVFSPVSEQGCFEFDKTLKSGQLMKRAKRTKTWKAVHLVLRQHVLSIYKDEHETQLRHQISLPDINAVAMRRERKRKGDHEGVFGLYMPYRTFHFEAATRDEAESWVALIRREARLDEDGERMLAGNSAAKTDENAAPPRQRRVGRSPLSTAVRRSSDRESSSSPDPAIRPGRAVTSTARKPIAIRQGSGTHDYSGGEYGSYSDFSDAPGFASGRDFSPMSAKRPDSALGPKQSFDQRTPAQSGAADALKDEARTILQGYLLCLKNRSGMRQWKRYWVVLRPKHLALYKNDDEYSASLILPTSSIVDAVDIDPVSKSKPFCMQIILDDRSHRFCAADDDDLSKWLGGIKSVLARRNASLA